MSHADEPEILILRPRPSITVALDIQADSCETLTRVAESRAMSPDALLKFYIGQGLRQDAARWFAAQIYLETERIILRRFTPEDLDNLHALDSDPEVMRYLTNGAAPSREATQEKLRNRIAEYDRTPNFGVWAAIEKETGAFIGWFHFRPDARNPDEDIELGYRLMRAAWGKGYATEVSRALIRKGFEELNVKRITARAMKANVNSWRVMEKVGMNFEVEYIEEKFPVDDKTAVRYELSREAYF